MFSFDKWSSAPILTDAIREAAANPDWQRRLFLVPRAHVTKLHVSNNAVTTLEVWVNRQQKFLNISNRCAVVLASGTIEATRLALESFPTSLMGRNLMAHLRTNTVVRIHRSAFNASLPRQLEAAALLVRRRDDCYVCGSTSLLSPQGTEAQRRKLNREIPEVADEVTSLKFYRRRKGAENR